MKEMYINFYSKHNGYIRKKIILIKRLEYDNAVIFALFYINIMALLCALSYTVSFTGTSFFSIPQRDVVRLICQRTACCREQHTQYTNLYLLSINFYEIVIKYNKKYIYFTNIIIVSVLFIILVIRRP